jgi:hypothetical protein
MGESSISGIIEIPLKQKINEEPEKNTWWKGKTCKAVLEINQHSIPVYSRTKTIKIQI